MSVNAPCCDALASEVRELGSIVRWSLEQTPIDVDLLTEAAARLLALGSPQAWTPELLADCPEAAP